MNRIYGVMRMQLRDKFFLIYMPWIVMLSSFLVNIFVGVLLDGKTTIYTGGIMSIYCYMFVAGILILVQTFPFALGLSVRRTDFFWGTTAVVAGVSVLSAIALFLFAFVESNLTNGWGVDVHFFHLPYLNDGSAAAQIWIFFSILLNMYFLGFLISSVYRRFGKAGMWVGSIVSILLFSAGTLVCTYYGWWGGIFGWLIGYTAFELALWMFAGAVLYALISYLLLRKATV
ncbi:hypothetical protein FE783_25240 [Paenibacillus mesophilus]|uniref:hypothetical protein n=1 Tax=Paenibacillus mesophilus TaxID=2582849 RepID=UPI00110D5FDC|nr:hypothetical protein [Paenibacillus mesophilus]TMV46618.1 hypothetical protein FE783_25240 [Paenibacillus mesophilus]